MSVNDIYTLPPKVRTMAEMADLLQAEQLELDLLSYTLAVIAKELNINSSEHLISRYEEQFDLPHSLSNITLSERRAKVIAKLNTRGSTTIMALRELVKIVTGCTSEIVEHFSDYSFSVIVHLLYPDATKDLQELILQIEEVKPAHLAFDTIAAIEPLRFNNHNELIIKRLAILLRHNNFGVESVYLDGRKSLDGSWKLSQAYSKGISFHQFKMPLSCQNTVLNSHGCQYQSIVKNAHKVRHIQTVITLKTVHLESVLEKAFKSNIVLKNPQSVKWAVIEDTMYSLDGSVALNGIKKLNAAIKRSEL